MKAWLFSGVSESDIAMSAINFFAPHIGRDRSKNRKVAPVRILVAYRIRASQRLVCVVASRIRGCSARLLNAIQIDKDSSSSFMLSLLLVHVATLIVGPSS